MRVLSTFRRNGTRHCRHPRWSEGRTFVPPELTRILVATCGVESRPRCSDGFRGGCVRAVRPTPAALLSTWRLVAVISAHTARFFTFAIMSRSANRSMPTAFRVVACLTTCFSALPIPGRPRATCCVTRNAFDLIILIGITINSNPAVRVLSRRKVPIIWCSLITSVPNTVILVSTRSQAFGMSVVAGSGGL